MDSSTTPRLGPRCPPVAESTVISSSRISPASCSSSATESRLTWSGESIRSSMRGIVSDSRAPWRSGNPDTEVHVLHFLTTRGLAGSFANNAGTPDRRQRPIRMRRRSSTACMVAGETRPQQRKKRPVETERTSSHLMKDSGRETKPRPERAEPRSFLAQAIAKGVFPKLALGHLIAPLSGIGLQRRVRGIDVLQESLAAVSLNRLFQDRAHGHSFFTGELSQHIAALGADSNIRARHGSNHIVLNALLLHIQKCIQNNLRMSSPGDRKSTR